MGIKRVAGAEKILPQNALPGVVDLPSNKTFMIVAANPNTAGDDLEPKKCFSTQKVAEEFKPTLEFQVKKIDNLGGDKVEENETTITMKYGEVSKQIMNDFEPDFIVAKAEDGDSSKVLLEQRIGMYVLDNLMQQMNKEEFKNLFENNKDQMIKMLDEEIERVKGLMEEDKFKDVVGD